MNTENSDKQKIRTAEQNAQARLVLIQLLWLFVVLIIAAMVWLYSNQKKLAVHVEERLAITKTFDNRMNDIDDRIFVLTHTQKAAEDETVAQNDMQLVGIQLAVVDKFYRDGNYQSTAQMLHLLKSQLASPKFALATPIKSALESAINDDLKSLDTLQKTTDPYQTDIIQLQEIQSQLMAVIDALPKLKLSNYDELTLRDGAMLVSLALSAAVTKDRPAMVIHLNNSLHHLNKLKIDEPAAKINLDTAHHTIKTLIDTAPTLPPLKSVNLLQGMPDGK